MAIRSGKFPLIDGWGSAGGPIEKLISGRQFFGHLPEQT